MIFFPMICFFFSFTSSKREGISFLRTEPLRAQSEKLSKESLRAKKKTRKELEKRQNKQVLADSHAL